MTDKRKKVLMQIKRIRDFCLELDCDSIPCPLYNKHTRDCELSAPPEKWDVERITDILVRSNYLK